MPRFFRSIFKPFSMPSAEMVALTEYEQAKRELLASQSAREYAQAMVNYNTDRVNRLYTYLNRIAGEKK